MGLIYNMFNTQNLDEPAGFSSFRSNAKLLKNLTNTKLLVKSESLLEKLWHYYLRNEERLIRYTKDNYIKLLKVI